MKQTLLSMAPVPAEVLKSLLVQLSPGVADTDVIDGHDMSAEELAKAFAKADVTLGDYTFKRGIGRELLAKNIVQLYKDNNESKDKSVPSRRRGQSKKYRDPNQAMGQFFNEFHVTTGIHRYL